MEGYCYDETTALLLDSHHSIGVDSEKGLGMCREEGTNGRNQANKRCVMTISIIWIKQIDFLGRWSQTIR